MHQENAMMSGKFQIVQMKSKRQ